MWSDAEMRGKHRAVALHDLSGCALVSLRRLVLADHRHRPVWKRAGERPGRLAGGADSNTFEGVGDHDRQPEDRRSDLAYRLGLRRAASESDGGDLADLLP